MAAVGGDSIVILRLRDPFQLLLASNKKLFYWFKQHAFVIFLKILYNFVVPFSLFVLRFILV